MLKISIIIWRLSALSSSICALFMGAAVLISPAYAATVIVTVNPTDNPFLAGAPDGVTSVGDSAPAQSPTLALTGFDTSQAITFSAVGGFNNAGGFIATGPDGGNLFAMAAARLGISGPLNVPANGLVGVFLDDSVPGGTAPTQRNDGVSFLSLSPLQRQIFWIGDGLTGNGSGTVQTFFAPAGATRLYLGPSDGFGWFNNSGGATVTINYSPLIAEVPEPDVWAMMIVGFGAIAMAMRARRPKENRLQNT